MTAIKEAKLIKRDEIKARYKLSKEQITKLQFGYELGVSTKTLIEEFGLNGLQPSQITYLFDNVVTDIMCPYCEMLLEREPATKTSGEKDAVCQQCGHKVSVNNWAHCSCPGCLDKRKQEAENAKKHKEKQICKLLDREHEKDYYEYEDLTHWEKLLLGALITFAMNEELEYMKPLEDCDKNLLPCPNKSIEVLRELYHSGVIILGNRYRPNAFVLDKEDKVSFYLSKLFFEEWTDNDNACTELLNPKSLMTSNQMLLLWRDLNKQEGIAQLLHVFQKMGITSFEPGKRTQELFATMAENLSLSQIFRMINYVTDKTAKDILTGDRYKKHDANATITRLESYYKRALHEGYSLYRVKYDEDLSMATTYLYNKVLNMGHSAFYSVPNSEMEEKTILSDEGK